jgi:hypothetical protein
MGIFNFFIVIPEILAALGFGEILERLLTNESAVVLMVGGDNRLTVVVIGGLSLAVAAALCAIVTDPAADAGAPSCPDPARLIVDATRELPHAGKDAELAQLRVSTPNAIRSAASTGDSVPLAGS